MVNVTPTRRKAISPRVAALVDAVNSRPHLRELFEECAAANLKPKDIKLLKRFAAALRGDTHG